MNTNRKLLACTLTFGLLTAVSVLAAYDRVESVLSVGTADDCTELRTAIEYSGLDQAFQPGGVNSICSPSMSSTQSGYILRLMIEPSALSGKPVTGPNRIPTAKCYRAVEAVKSKLGSLFTISSKSYLVDASCVEAGGASNLVFTAVSTDK